MADHDFRSGICQICGMSQVAAKHFGWKCSGRNWRHEQRVRQLQIEKTAAPKCRPLGRGRTRERLEEMAEDLRGRITRLKVGDKEYLRVRVSEVLKAPPYRSWSYLIDAEKAVAECEGEDVANLGRTFGGWDQILPPDTRRRPSRIEIEASRAGDDDDS